MKRARWFVFKESLIESFDKLYKASDVITNDIQLIPVMEGASSSLEVTYRIMSGINWFTFCFWPLLKKGLSSHCAPVLWYRTHRDI